MNTAIYFRLSDNGTLKHFSTRSNRVVVEVLDIFKEILSLINARDLSIHGVGPGHMPGLAFATFKFDTENVQVGLISELKSPEDQVETNAFQLFFWSSVPFWKGLFGCKPIHPEYIDKTLGAFKQVLREKMHTTDVQILTDAEARLLKEFH